MRAICLTPEVKTNQYYALLVSVVLRLQFFELRLRLEALFENIDFQGFVHYILTAERYQQQNLISNIKKAL